MRHIDVYPTRDALGAEIHGLDLAHPLTDDARRELNQAFLDHLVLFFRDQKLTPAQQLAFARQLGEPVAYPQLRGLPECPLITPVKKLEHETVNFGGVWHSDTTYLQCPPMASMLYALETPLTGGDTLFANQYLAYEMLPEDIRISLDGLVAVNTSAKADASRTREDRMRDSGDVLKVLEARHPAVRTHPESGRKALYVNVGHTSHFDGKTAAESQSLLNFLFEHQVQDRFVTRFHWNPGSLALWDNRCVQHFPVNDYQGQRRIMHRITLAGDTPY